MHHTAAATAAAPVTIVIIIVDHIFKIDSRRWRLQLSSGLSWRRVSWCSRRGTVNKKAKLNM